MNAAERIIVALDTNVQGARELAQKLEGQAHWLKVGMTLYYSAGPAIVAELKGLGYSVFVDLKLHDIPHQVFGAARAVVEAGADMLTAHAAGGTEMLRAVCRGAEEGCCSLSDPLQKGARPFCLAITVLTSLSDQMLARVGVPVATEQQVLRLATVAEEAGMDGIVCSPKETALIRKQLDKSLTIVSPGVRPAGSKQNDQSRVATPASALAAGADYLVIGRPITEAADPREAFKQIVEEIAQ